MLQLHVLCENEDDDIHLLQRGWGLSVCEGLGKPRVKDAWQE